jgi:nitrate reductase molybdenum cofactor assembly chaperone NarJ/NarW
MCRCWSCSDCRCRSGGSGYASILGAILATLSPISTADRRRIAELAAAGPPEEDVGLEPFAMDPLSAGGRR